MDRLSSIPHEDLIAMLKERVWFSGGSSLYDRQGYSLDVDPETAIRDVNYRNVPLYLTAEEAIWQSWLKYFGEPIIHGN